MTPAAKLQVVLDCYNQGLFCKCKRKEFIFYDMMIGESIFRTIHTKKCKAGTKVKELLNFKD